MKRLALAALLAVAINAQAADEWTTADKSLAAGVITAYALDWAQTRDISNHHDLRETNPLLGEHPGYAKINNYFVATGLVTLGIAHILPSKYRKIFLTSVVVVEVGFIANNAHLGLKMRF